MINKYQRVGLHVSAAGGVENAPENAKQIDAEVFQFFSRSPRGGKAPELTKDKVRAFKSLCKRYNLESYIHTPYYINFASKKRYVANSAPRIIREELERGSLLGVKYVVTHLGSTTGWDSTNAAIKQTINGLRKIYDGGLTFSAKLLLEISAGAGKVLGKSFEELGYVLKELERKDVHVCLDTCHMFASGYDIRDKKSVDKTMKDFKKNIGFNNLKLTHINDSMTDLDSHRDRHAHIGQGKIGANGFRAIVSHPAFQKSNFILETKHDEFLKNDMKLLKKYREL